MILRNLYDEAQTCKDPDRLRTIYASVSKRSVLLHRYPNDSRLIARMVAENQSSDDFLLCEIVRGDSLELCYCVANNINADNIVFYELYDRLIHFKPEALPSNLDDSLWGLAVKSMIKNYNIPAEMLMLLAEGREGTGGAFGPEIAEVARRQIQYIANRAQNQ